MDKNDFYYRYGVNINLHQVVQLNPVGNIVAMNILRINNFRSVGHNYLNNISAVIYQNNVITFYPLNQNTTAISYDFSGCYMAKFQFNNQCFVCHIFCSGIGASGDCRDAWNRFITQNRARISNLILFKPTAGYTVGDLGRVRARYPNANNTAICGLITTNNRCYSLLLDKSHHFLLRKPKKITSIKNGLIQ